jgi:PIN domain nuclease of toxin-antitoxin system
VKLLLDMHAFLWHAEGNPQLSPVAAAALADFANDLSLSMASLWEIAIKLSLGKLTLAVPFQDFVSQALAGYGISVLPIALDDVVACERLPFPDREHRDPFDRMIAAQALRLGYVVLGKDTAFDAYGVARHW